MCSVELLCGAWRLGDVVDAKNRSSDAEEAEHWSFVEADGADVYRLAEKRVLRVTLTLQLFRNEWLVGVQCSTRGKTFVRYLPVT